MDDLKAMRVFLEVAGQASFAAAARSLGLTAASVTRIVAQLEEDLGQQLLLRTTRHVSLTSAGAIAVARMRPIVEDFDAARASLKGEVAPEMGHLRVNAPLSFGMRVMPGVIAAFRQAFPKITVDLHLTDRFIDILDGRYDLAIRISGPPADKSTIWRKICEVPRVAVAAPEWCDRVGRPAVPDDLKAEALMSYSSDGRAEIWRFRRDSQRRDMRAGTAVISNNGEFLCACAQTGMGACVLPRFIVAEALEREALEEILPDWTLAPLWLTLYYPPYEQLPPLVATFSAFFEDYISQNAEASGL